MNPKITEEQMRVGYRKQMKELMEKYGEVDPYFRGRFEALERSFEWESARREASAAHAAASACVKAVEDFRNEMWSIYEKSNKRKLAMSIAELAVKSTVAAAQPYMKRD